jgi:hypothetical protein
LFVDPYLHISLSHSLCVSFFSPMLVVFVAFLFSFFPPYTFSVKFMKSPMFRIITSDNTTLHDTNGSCQVSVQMSQLTNN